MTADAATGRAPHESRLVTISAAYGAGGSVVAPGLAERLGVPFLQRMTSTTDDLEDCGPCVEQLTPAEARHTPVHRMLTALVQGMPVGPTQSPPPAHLLEDELRGNAEQGIHRMAASGEGVILGRGAAVVLGKSRGFHVRLDGPPDRRAAQGATIEGISRDEAMARLGAADKARTAYVRRLYRVNPADNDHYHLVIDSTAIPLTAVTEIILQALSARTMVPS
ncbi:MAG: cytidylate kinase-like family protein [Actinobacteria bacterium]|nr:cytidylate kinase-like family protein [Actinomycetota bacterium]